MQLDEIRKEIDTVDDEMRTLFIRRMELSRQVALVKARTGDAVRKPDREKAMIARLCEGMDPQLLDVYRSFLEHILFLSRSLQEQLLRRGEAGPCAQNPESREA